MAGLRGPIVLVLRERRLVDQEVGAVRGHLQCLARHRVAGDDELAARTRWPEHMLGRDSVDGLAALHTSEVRSGREAETDGFLGIELPRPFVLE